MTNTQKRCPRCGETKALAAFSPGNRRCKSCKSADAVAKYWANVEWREERKAYHREQSRQTRADPEKRAVILEKLRVKRATNEEWRDRTSAAAGVRRRKFLGRALAIAAKKRARVRDQECTITPEWVQGLWEQAPKCAYCGCALRSSPDMHAPDSASLDRVDTSKGYTVENTVFACFRCNTLKRDASLEELETLVANIRRVQSGESTHLRTAPAEP